jgi:putative transposase
VLEDESGFSLVSPIKRTWARRGQTPIVCTSIDHHIRLNFFGALLVRPDGKWIRLSVKSYWHSLTGKDVIAFLKQVLRLVPGPVILVWDRHPNHHRKMVQDFLARQARLSVYLLPVAAPELNPVEYVWAQVSEYTAGTAPHNRHELQALLFAAIARTRRSARRLWAFLLATPENWLAG